MKGVGRTHEGRALEVGRIGAAKDSLDIVAGLEARDVELHLNLRIIVLGHLSVRHARHWAFDFNQTPGPLGRRVVVDEAIGTRRTSRVHLANEAPQLFNVRAILVIVNLLDDRLESNAPIKGGHAGTRNGEGLGRAGSRSHLGHDELGAKTRAPKEPPQF